MISFPQPEPVLIPSHIRQLTQNNPKYGQKSDAFANRRQVLLFAVVLCRASFNYDLEFFEEHFHLFNHLITVQFYDD